jgi:hypothetical protein
MNITLAEIERAINHWRTIKPSFGEECSLSEEVNALASVYAKMIFNKTREVSLASLGPETQATLLSGLHSQQPATT